MTLPPSYIDIAYCPFCTCRNKIELVIEKKVDLESHEMIVMGRINRCIKCNTDSIICMSVDETKIVGVSGK